MRLSPRARLTWLAHVFKACTRQHHRELRALLSRLLDRDAVVVDVGAHAGQFTKLFASCVPDGRVYAFEPGGYARSVLSVMLRLRRFANVTPLPYGLGDADGTATLTVPIKPSGSVGFGLSHMGEGGADPELARRAGWRFVDDPVTVRTLDGVVEALSIPRVDFIKADIEGWELRCLMGARETLGRFRPVLMLEVVDGHLARAGDGAAALYAYLGEFGYRAFRYDARSDTLHPLQGPAEGDVVFIADGPG